MVSSGPARQSDGSHPAGNTESSGDRVTPRHVLLASRDNLWPGGKSRTSRRQSTHELDEMGLNPSAFETLRSALEKHQSNEGLLGESGTQEGRANAPPSIPAQVIFPLRDNPSRVSNRYPFASPPVALSAVPTSDNPYPTTSAPQVQALETRVKGDTTHNPPTMEDITVHPSASTLVAHRTYDVPGEAWIDPQEREGLPIHAPIPVDRVRRDVSGAFRRRSTWRSGPRENDDTAVDEQHIARLAEHQAAGVVRAHTRRGWGWLHGSPEAKNATGLESSHEEKGKASGPQGRHRHAPSENDAAFNGAEFRRPGRMRRGVPSDWFSQARHIPNDRQHQSGDRHLSYYHGPNLGNGVLSTLLALYGHDRDDDGSTSGASSPGGQSPSSSDAGSEEGILPRPLRPWLPDQNNLSATMAGKYNSREKFSIGRHKGGAASSILGHFRTPSLPMASTTAALIAGVGSLSGAAAPRQATLAPNLKRPGFNLVRYSVEEIPRASRIPSVLSRDFRRARKTKQDITTDRPASVDKESEADSPGTPAPTVVAPPIADSKGLLPESKRKANVSTLGGRRGWTRLKDLPLAMHFPQSHLRGQSASNPTTLNEKDLYTSGGSGTATPWTACAGGTPVEEFGEEEYFDPKHTEREAQRIKEQERNERKDRKKKREQEVRRKRKKAEVYITRHVAEILQRQEFILKLARAMMMFGGPSHRLVSQIQSTGRVLDLELSCMYLPDVMLISFEDSTTGTTNVKFIRQSSALDLGKLGDAHLLYWNVIHDNISAPAASASLDVLMRKKPLYNFTQLVITGGMCSAFICSLAFSGSFIDSLASAPLGALLVAVQLVGARNELYANVFEITIATLLSFLSAVLASTKHFCFTAVASSSVVLILPGFIVLSGSLELSSRCLVAGSVRLCFAVMYSLFLGFGLAIGAELYEKIVGQAIIGPTDYVCINSHDPSGPWWQQTPSLWWAFLTVPMYSLFLSIRLMAPWWNKEMVLLTAMSSIGWVTNHFVGIKFPNQGDISAAVGAFTVGFVSNMYGRFFNGNTFVIMITGILFQLPSGLGSGGLLNFALDQVSGSSSSISYLSGFQTALQLISVAIGLTVGLGISLVVVHPVQSRRRAGGLFTL